MSTPLVNTVQPTLYTHTHTRAHTHTHTHTHAQRKSPSCCQRWKCTGLLVLVGAKSQAITRLLYIDVVHEGGPQLGTASLGD